MSAISTFVFVFGFVFLLLMLMLLHSHIYCVRYTIVNVHLGFLPSSTVDMTLRFLVSSFSVVASNIDVMQIGNFCFIFFIFGNHFQIVTTDRNIVIVISILKKHNQTYSHNLHAIHGHKRSNNLALLVALYPMLPLVKCEWSIILSTAKIVGNKKESKNVEWSSKHEQLSIAITM